MVELVSFHFVLFSLPLKDLKYMSSVGFNTYLSR